MIENILDYDEEEVKRPYFDICIRWMVVYILSWFASDYFYSISESNDLFNDIYADIGECFNLGFLISSIISIVYLFISYKIQEEHSAIRNAVLVATSIVFIYVLIYFICNVIALYHILTT